MSNIPFHCKQCGSEKFKVLRKVETMDDMRGAVCSDCGTEFSEEDIKNQARQIAANLIREKMKGLKFS
jgi:predicted Zn-ribbon and HTH transcriptional regulator